MSQYNCTTNPRKFKHLKERERYTIETLLKEGLKASDIAKRLEKSTRTVEREISKGTVVLINSNLTYRREYCADAGQRVYEENCRNKGPELKIGKDHKLVKHIEDKIVKHKYAPDAVIGEIEQKGYKFDTKICTKTVYNYIDRGDVFLRLTNKDLPVKKDKKKHSYKKVKIAHKNLKGTSIEDRPESVESRDEYGHWEMDCVVGNQGGSGAALLVLSERKIKEEIIFKMPDKTQSSVIIMIDELERKYGSKFKEKFKTITVDNGSEFLDFKGLEQSIKGTDEKRVPVYYAHPFSSWERGTNENSNKLIRRFIPKGTDIGKISKKTVKRIENWMNSYPRRILGYKSAKDMALG
ncbi:MAG: IS30 family transposase [bacterium]